MGSYPPQVRQNCPPFPGGIYPPRPALALRAPANQPLANMIGGNHTVRSGVDSGELASRPCFVEVVEIEIRNAYVPGGEVGGGLFSLGGASPMYDSQSIGGGVEFHRVRGVVDPGDPTFRPRDIIKIKYTPAARSKILSKPIRATCVPGIYMSES